MEIYDIVMLVIILGAALWGAVKGFAWQLASIASIVVSYIVAYKFREPFSQSIQADPPWNRFLAMLILFIGTSLFIWVGFRMISKTIDRLKLKEFDRHIGFVFGGIKGFLYCTLITLFAVTLMGETIRGKIVASKSGHFIAEVLDHSDSVIPEEIHVVIRPYLERFDQRFQESQNSLQNSLQNRSAPDLNPSTRFARETGLPSFQNSGQQPTQGYRGGANYQPIVPTHIPGSSAGSIAQPNSAQSPQYRSATVPQGGYYQQNATGSGQTLRNF